MAQKKDVGIKTHFICQMYEKKKGPRGKPSVLSVAATIECANHDEVLSRAERTYEKGTFVGVDAYRVDVDPVIGEPTQPLFIVRLGEVPELEF